MEQFNPKPVAEDIETKVGNLSGLNTTEKTSLVGAVNEVNSNITTLSEQMGMQQILSGNAGTAIPWTLSTIKNTYKELCIRALKRTDTYNYYYYLVINIPTVMLDNRQVYEVSDVSGAMTIEILSGSIKVSVTYNGSAVANEVKIYAR